MSAAKKPSRKRFSTSINVDVEIDEDDLIENGYHHEEDCPAEDAPDTAADFRALEDWHHETHGYRLWAMCQEEPCKRLSDEFRSAP